MAYFLDTPVNILGNNRLRRPQVESYAKICQFFEDNPRGEALVVLPTGTGKSGLVSIAPYGICRGRCLIITPGLVTKDAIGKTQDALQDNFWVNYGVLFNIEHLPVVSEFHADITDAHLEQSNIVYANIQKLVRGPRALINRVGRDFFDMVIVDEAHHVPAESWRTVLGYFDGAKKLHVTGTPFRGDNQELPGERIHETPLSEVMRDQYVKWLRKHTISATQLYFTMPERPGQRLTKEDVLEYKDQEWLEKSVALAEECSKDVIRHSLAKLKEFKSFSPKVPHKILAVGCSIAHAKDLSAWYREAGASPVLIHSELPDDQKAQAFRLIDTHQCDVVVSVNMLMEGYDHAYLSTLAIFRPYRSLNAFAQVVGRVLRTIPSNEITSFEVDNNAIVVYHADIGLDCMWEEFRKEVERAQRPRVRDYDFSDAEYDSRHDTFASVTVEGTIENATDSYLLDIDFNAMFEKAQRAIADEVEAKAKELRKAGISEDVIQRVTRELSRDMHKEATAEIDPLLIEKRPHLARKAMRESLTRKVQEQATCLLSDLEYDEKGTELAPKFSRVVHNLKPDTPNDGVLVRYINTKLSAKYGAVGSRDNRTLLRSIDEIDAIITEIREML